MTDKTFNVLFLCTGNSARGILAECILNRSGQGRFKGYSAGSHPTGQVNPNAINLLKSLNHPVDGLRSKDCLEFAESDAPTMDFVFTVCDQAAGEVCPIWPGQPMSAHWGLPDPAAVEGTDAEIAAAFAETYRMMNARLEAFINLPLKSLDRLTLQKQLYDMGGSTPESA
ncbi:MAG: arsenate reductase ArsC [Alphaproteobacteria bacterium]